MRLDERFRRIERKRDRLLKEVEALDADALHAHPRPAKWSIHEIVEHLVVAEEDVVGGYDDLEALEPRPRGVKHRLAYLVVMFVLRFDIPVQAPSESMLPKGEHSLRALRERWESNHSRMREYLGGIGPGDAHRAVFRHPIAGPLTVAQGLRMLEVHLDRHMRQIRMLRGMQSGAPRSS